MCVCVCVSEVHDEIRRERNLEMLVIRNRPSIARDWLFLTGILFCVPPEHEKRISFLECMKKSKTVDSIRNISQANCSTLSSESCKAFIRVGAVPVLYFLKCKKWRCIAVLNVKDFPEF
jgi:hypothetical protein